jgi:hypothetical protein
MARLLRISLLVGATAGLEVLGGHASPERLFALGALLAGIISLRLIEQ